MDQDETWHAGRPRPGQIVLDGDPAPPLQKGHSPQFSAHVCSGQTAGWIKMSLGTEVVLGQGNIVFDWDPLSPKTGGTGTAPPILAHVYCGQTAGWIRMPLGTEVGLVPGDLVLDGDPAFPKRGHSPPFSAHVYCDQTAGWIKMPLGMAVDFGPATLC